MAKFELEWHGEEVEKLLRKADLGMQAAAQHLRNRTVKNISIPTATEGPSAPGEMPHADTGRLKQSIQVAKYGEHEYGVETDVEYGLIHETGVRPFMRPTMLQEFEMMKRIIQNVVGKDTPISFDIIDPDQAE